MAHEGLTMGEVAGSLPTAELETIPGGPPVIPAGSIHHQVESINLAGFNSADEGQIRELFDVKIDSFNFDDRPAPFKAGSLFIVRVDVTDGRMWIPRLGYNRLPYIACRQVVAEPPEANPRLVRSNSREPLVKPWPRRQTVRPTC